MSDDSFQPKDQDPIMSPNDFADVWDYMNNDRLLPLPTFTPESTIQNPDVSPLIGAPTDDKWTYYNEYQQEKKKEEVEKIDYEKLSEEFTKSANKELTKKEKDDIINNIAWSDE